jgi:lysozyme
MRQHPFLPPDIERYLRLQRKLAEAYKNARRVAFAHYLRKGFVPPELVATLKATESYAELQKYSPDQPRVPAGNPDGGQWTSGGGGSDGNGDPLANTIGDLAPNLVDQGIQLVDGGTGTETTVPSIAQPAEDLSVSQQGLDFITSHENFKPTTYLDQAGRPTIGYGHLLQPGESFPNGITKEDAQQLLRNDVSIAENAVQRDVTVPLTQPQFDALVSFTYNVGTDAFQNSTLLRLLNQGDYNGAADQLPNWHYVSVSGGEHRPSSGLMNRRNRERNMFLNGDYGNLG